MKKKLVVLSITLGVLCGVSACGLSNSGLSNSDSSNRNPSSSAPSASVSSSNSYLNTVKESIRVTAPLVCPAFTTEKNTSSMMDQFAFTAQDYFPTLTDEQTSQIISATREADHKFYNGPEEMEKYMWYGYLLVQI